MVVRLPALAAAPQAVTVRNSELLPVIGGGHAPVFDPTTVDKMLSLKPLVGLGVQSDPATNGGEETILQEEFTDHGCSTFEVTDGLLTKELAGSDLQFNKTVSGTLGEDDYHFFQVCVAKHMHEHELSIVVTTISGDADLYMSSTITRPTAEHSTWISASIGTDSVILTTDHPDWDVRSPALYLGIYGRYASKYTLNVSIRVAPDPAAAGKRLRGRG